jgi:hypothetical protein
MYAGVPHYSVMTSDGEFNSLDTPKSHIFTMPCSSNSKLSSFISL